MGWLSVFKSRSDAGTPPAAATPASPDTAARARTRARQRLIGAVVLVVIGVIGFPLVFETRPRPIPVDVAIEIPRKETAAPLRVPGTAPAPAPAPAPTVKEVAPAPRPEPVKDEAIVTETAADAGKELPALAPKSNEQATPAAPVPAKPAARDPATPAAKAAAVEKAAPTAKAVVAEKAAPAASSGARAKALLEGADAPAKSGARYVVQVGAFAENAAASELRSKVEKLGLKTYTQSADTPAGKRIRVRLGPFASREEADSALARARAAGVSGNVLTL